LGEFTTYLGHLVKSEEGKQLNGRPLYKETLQISPLVMKEILGKYEATLTICCYFSRLNYEWRARNVLKMLGIIDYSPIIFNKALAYLSSTNSTADQLEPSTKKKHRGYLIYDKHEDILISMAVVDILGEKCLVISFRGTETIRNLLKDFNILFHEMKDVLGEGLFSEEHDNIEKREKELIHPFGAHRGFLTGLQNVYENILMKTKSLLDKYSNIKRIFLTGHSLGGAYANIFGLALAQMKKKSIMELPDIHLITMGAPKTFSAYARNVFNKLLLEKYLTLDRITNRSRFPDPTLLTYDIIPLLPFFMEHPGFSTLGNEIKTQSRTGRTIHISELRDELAGIKAKTHLLSKIASYNYNPLADYPEFFSNFKDSSTISADEYSILLNTNHMSIIKDEAGDDELTQRVNTIIQNIFNITENEFKQAEAISRSRTLTEIKDAKKNPIKIPKELIEDMEKKKTLMDKAYSKVKKGGNPSYGNPDIDEYRKQTVLEQPNQIVYSFPQATSFLSLLLWHKKYMGVLFGGANAPNREKMEWRGYDKEAILYEHDGIWTYTTDIRSNWLDIIKKRTTRKRHSKKRNTRRANP